MIRLREMKTIKLNLLFGNVLLFLLCGCSLLDTSLPTPTISWDVPLATITPTQHETVKSGGFPDDAWVIVSWSQAPATIYHQYVTRNGQGWRWRETPRAIQNPTIIELSNDSIATFEVLVNQLILERPEPDESIGTIGVSILIQSPVPIRLTCGSRNCSPLVRELLWVMVEGFTPASEYLPFADEEHLYSRGLSARNIALFSWLEDNTKPFQVLRINENNLLETYLYLEQVYSSNKIVAYEGWQVRDKEMTEIETCLDLLLQKTDTDISIDSEVIKFSHFSQDNDSLIRLDKKTPPSCLQGIMDLAQKTLQRENSKSTLDILPFDK